MFNDNEQEDIIEEISSQSNSIWIENLIKRQKINLNYKSKKYWGATPTLVAARFGNTEVFDYCVKQDISLLLSKDDFDRTALLLATAWGHIDFIRNLLIKHHVDINDRYQKDNIGRTALLTAAANGQKEMVEFLLTNGAKYDVVDAEGNNALLSALNFEITHVMSARGRNDNNNRWYGTTEYLLITHQDEFSWDSSNNKGDTVKSLLKSVSNFNKLDIRYDQRFVDLFSKVNTKQQLITLLWTKKTKDSKAEQKNYSEKKEKGCLAAIK